MTCRVRKVLTNVNSMLEAPRVCQASCEMLLQ